MGQESVVSALGWPSSMVFKGSSMLVACLQLTTVLLWPCCDCVTTSSHEFAHLSLRSRGHGSSMLTSSWKLHRHGSYMHVVDSGCRFKQDRPDASSKCYSRVRHFGGVFYSPVQMTHGMCHGSTASLGDDMTAYSRRCSDRTARVRAPSVWIPTSLSSSFRRRRR